MMKKWFLWLLTSGGMLAGAQASPVLNAGHYYEVTGGGDSWDIANVAANGKTYTVDNVTYYGHLVTITSESEFAFVKSLLGEWSIVAVGAYNNNGTYTWVNNEGTVNFSGWSSSPWASGEPGSTEYGTTLSGSGYGSQMASQAFNYLMGEMVVEYEAVPEPTSLALIALGLAVVGVRRRNTKR